MLNIRVAQSTQTSGLGTIQLDAPANNRRSFVDAFGTGAAVYYVIESADGVSWEAGFGVITAGSPDTLTRNVIESSNGDALVNFSAGSKRVMCAQNADALRFGAAGDVPQVTGTAAHMLLSYKPAVRHLRNGMEFSFATAAACVGATDLSIDGSTAYPVVNIHDGSDPVANQWRNNQILKVIYFNGVFALVAVCAKAVLDDVVVNGASLLSGASGTSLIFIDHKVAAASATLDFTAIPAGYDSYMLEIANIVPATAATDLQLLVSDDNAATFKSSGYRWSTYVVTDGGTSGAAGSNAAASIKVAPNLANNGGIGLSGTVRMKGLGTAGVFKHMIVDTSYYDNTAAYKRGMGNGVYTGNSNAINALRLSYSSGNIATGNVALYGLRNS